MHGARRVAGAMQPEQEVARVCSPGAVRSAQRCGCAGNSADFRNGTSDAVDRRVKNGTRKSDFVEEDTEVGSGERGSCEPTPLVEIVWRKDEESGEILLQVTPLERAPPDLKTAR
jgi:hypothetical protein